MITPQQDYTNRLKAWLKREAELRREIAALKAENDRLTERNSFLENALHAAKLDAGYVDELKAENERLRAALDLIRRGYANPADIAADALAVSRLLSPEHPPSGSKP